MGNIWVISDTHFGIKNNSKLWESIFNQWSEDFFFQLVQKHCTSKSGNVLVHLGDVFDDRQTIGLNTMNFAIKFFEKATDFFDEVYILCGNHDAYNKTSNDVSSLDCLKYIPHVNVIKTVEHKNIFGRNVAFIPWIESNKKVKEAINDEDYDTLVFCHADFGGCTMNAYGKKSESSLSAPDIMKLYSGHIHHRQVHGSVTYTGSPYHLGQNDRNNSKGVYVINAETLEETFFENALSPQFTRMDYSEVENMTFGDFKKICKNKFVELLVDGDLLSRAFFKRIFTYIKDEDKICNLVFVPNGSKTSSHKKTITLNDCVSIDDMLDKYIDSMFVDSELKLNIKKISKKLINGQ